MLSQILLIKRTRETALRNRVRRLEQQVHEHNSARENSLAERALLRKAWREASLTEQAVSGASFQKLKDTLHRFYEDEQKLQATLSHLNEEIERKAGQSNEIREMLKANLRGQEKLLLVIKESA
jgi:hypothetical protein